MATTFGHQFMHLPQAERDAKLSVLDEAAERGITAVWTPAYDHWIRLWNRYQERGGKLRIWIGQPDPAPEEMKAHITAAAKNGAKAICIQGERIDGIAAADEAGWLLVQRALHLFDAIDDRIDHVLQHGGFMRRGCIWSVLIPRFLFR